MSRKRIVFCTYPSLYSDIVLDELVKSEQVELVGVIISKRILSKRYHKFQASLHQIKQSGLRYAIYLFVITDLYVMLGRFFRKATLTKRLNCLGIPILETVDINDGHGIAFVRELRTDVLLSAHFNQLIGQDILEMGDLACLNIHPSLLPEYKGVDPAFYALLRGEQKTGVTVHFQAEAFDTGRVLAQQATQIRWHDSLLSLNIKLFKLGAINFLQTLADLPEAHGQEQSGEGSYDSWPEPKQVKQFRKQRSLWRWKELLGMVRRQ